MEGHIMSSKVNTVKPKPNANEALMAKLGIKASQVDQTKVNTTPKAKVINSNADRLKHNAVISISCRYTKFALFLKKESMYYILGTLYIF